MEVHYFETYLSLILSFIFFFLTALSVTFWLSFMGIFICCRALNTPDHGIQSLYLSIQGVEDTMPSPRVQGGVGKSEGVGQEFCKQADISFIYNKLSSCGLNLLQGSSPACCNPFKTHTSLGMDCLHPIAYLFLSMATYSSSHVWGQWDRYSSCFWVCVLFHVCCYKFYSLIVFLSPLLTQYFIRMTTLIILLKNLIFHTVVQTY